MFECLNVLGPLLYHRYYGDDNWTRQLDGRESRDHDNDDNTGPIDDNNEFP